VDYLEELRGHGRVDSSGAFSIDAVRSQAILNRHSVPEPEQYVLKLVQGMVALQPSEIRVLRSSRQPHFLELYATNAQPIDKPNLNPDLMMGLSAALGLGHSVEVSQNGASLFGTPTRDPGYGLLVRISLIARPKREFELLKERCCCCSVPVSLGSTHRYGGIRGLARICEDPWLYSERMFESIAADGLPQLSIAPRRRAEVWDEQARPWFHRKAALYLRQYQGRLLPGGSDEKPIPATSVVSLSTSLQGPCWLRLVRQGVLLEPVSLPMDFGSEVLLNGDDVPMDLSGLKARESPELEAVRKKATQLLSETASSALARLDRIQLLPPPLSKLGLNRLIVGVLLGITSVFLSALFILMSYLQGWSFEALLPVFGLLLTGHVLRSGGTPDYNRPLHWNMSEVSERLRKLESL
jgi:hypothetical protein